MHRLLHPAPTHGAALRGRQRIFSALLVFAPLIAGAQGTVTTSVVDGHAGTPDNPAFLCGSTSAVQNLSSAFSCTSPLTNGVVTASVSGSAINGILRASSSVAVVFATTPPDAPFGSEVSAVAMARWDDQAFVTALSPAPAAARLKIIFGVTGSTAAVETAGQSALGDGIAAFGQFQAQSASSLDVPVGGSISSGSTPGFPDATMNSEYVFSLFLDPSGTSSNFFYDFLTFADAARSASNPSPVTGASIADFSHTAIPLSFEVLDANGHDVTADYNVRFANGMTFGAATSPITTPEPGSFLMLGTGIFGLIGFRTLRRNRG